MTTAAPPDIDGTRPPERRPRRLAWSTVAGLVVVTIVLGYLAARLLLSVFQPHLYAGTVLQSPTAAPAMSGLTFADGEPFEMGAFEGDVVILYFGYTNCPDVCPTTLSTVARARAELSEGDRERTHLVMVSVDPERDSLEELQEYVEFFDPAFLGVGGTAEDIHTAATQYGIYYILNGDDVEAGYTVDHTANLLAVGPDGALRVIWAPDVSSDDLAADIEELLG